MNELRWVIDPANPSKLVTTDGRFLIRTNASRFVNAGAGMHTTDEMNVWFWTTDTATRTELGCFASLTDAKRAIRHAAVIR